MIANDNDASRVLARTFQTRQGADDAAIKLAIRGSASGLARRVTFLEWAYAAKEGGSAYEHCVLPEGWGVREIPANELARRLQSGLRREIDRLLEEAGKSAERARQLIGKSFASRHSKEAAQYRDRARALETQVTVAIARTA